VPLPTFRLDGRVALVTGAGQGIGRAIALGLAEAGASVVVTDRDKPKLRAVAGELASAGFTALTIAMDVGDPAAIDGGVATVLDRYERIDVLVNNAGVRVHKPVLDHTLEDWERVFRVNCTGAFLLCQAAARSMREGSGGSIINISSQMAVVTSPQRVAYCASKAALNQMTRVMAVDWARFNIRVNAIGPGPIDTPFTRSVQAAGTAPIDHDMVPLGRIGMPDEIVGAALYLACDASSYVTGSFFVVDGGQSVLWR
jgi:NAD(P)-dependent dehydrogenase (short-subunit alcohol dehydrogenase family)